MTDFWDKVDACEGRDEDLSPEYCYATPCGTPYCGGGYEFHCLKCGVYETKCDCHSCDGMSGWSGLRWDNYWKKKDNV
jgi:hypothetical protein